MKDDEPNEMALLLPWYVSGRLGADDAARLEAALAESPDLRRALEDERRLRAAIADAKMPEPKDIDPVALLEASLPAQPRRADWMRPALAAAVALAVMEGVALAWLSQPSVYRTATAPAATEEVGSSRFAVHFVESATIGRIRAVLDEAEAGIVRGPLPDGAYIVDAPRGEPVVEILMRSGIAREIARTK
jgi:hypothetical protein